MCWLPYPQNSITGNTPYGTGNATHPGNVRCPYWYCTPLYFTSFLANALRYVPIQSLSKFSYYPQSHLPVSLQRKTLFPVWQSRKLQYQYSHGDVRRQYRFGNPEYNSTGTVMKTFEVNTGMVIPKNLSTCKNIFLYQ